MKRPLIGVLLVLAMTSWAMAKNPPTCYFEVNSPLPFNTYPPGSTIQIDLYDTGRVIEMEFDAITDNVGGSPLGSVSSEAFASGWTNTFASTFNSDNLLVEWMAAVMSSGTISGTLYSFEYKVPEGLTNGTNVTLTTVTGTDMYYINDVYYIGGSYWKAPPELTLTISVGIPIPEPATMLLLGLGGLLLRRRK